MTTPIQTFGSILSWGAQVVANVMDINGPGETAEVEDITNHSSPQKYREKVATILDGGELTFDLVYNHEVGQGVLRAAFQAMETDEVIITWPDGSTATFDGLITTWGWATPVAGTLRANIGITVTGPVNIVEATS